MQVERNAALHAWFAENKRALPWRGETDPYPILVAEVMSQQTQASRLGRHFVAFMNTFPTVGHLARAPFKDVAEIWSGLGYNSRARRLHDAAKQINAEGWPTTAATLTALPGVGDYTAAAVAAFAFGEQVPAVDTNLRRVLSRWHGEALSGSRLVAIATDAMSGDAAQWNEALMDLGALVCTPRSPKCATCPVSQWCAGPDTYAAPRPQGRFRGSNRQARGAVMRHLIRRPMNLEDLGFATDIDRGRIEEAIASLMNDGLIQEAANDQYRIAD